MDSRRIVFRETGIVLIGEAICVAVMLGVCWLLDWFNAQIILGGCIGGLLAVGNFFFMAIGASLAADKAEKEDVKGGQALIRGSYFLRILVLFIILVACTKSGIAHPLTLVLPLVFVRPALTVAEFFKKKEG